MIELLIVVAMMAGIFLLSAPFALNFYYSQLINEEQNNLINTLQRARHYAVLQKNDSKFGVDLNSVAGSYVLFQGNSYGQVPAQDEVYAYTGGVTLTSALNSIVFNKIVGTPNATGTITLTSGNLVRNILIDDNGVISVTEAAGGGDPEVSDGPIAYWTFDGNMNDDIGNYDGTCSGEACPALAVGVVGQAYTFDGLNDFIEIPGLPVFGSGDEYTVVGWFFQGPYYGSDVGIVSSENEPANPEDGSTTGFEVFLSPYDCDYGLYCVGGAEADGDLRPGINFSEWYNFAYVYDGSNAKLYLNGVGNNVSSTSLTDTTDSSWFVGAFYHGTEGYFDGFIDEVRLYNRALTAQEVEDIYNAEKP